MHWKDIEELCIVYSHIIFVQMSICSFSFHDLLPGFLTVGLPGLGDRNAANRGHQIRVAWRLHHVSRAHLPWWCHGGAVLCHDCHDCHDMSWHVKWSDIFCGQKKGIFSCESYLVNSCWSSWFIKPLLLGYPIYKWVIAPLENKALSGVFERGGVRGYDPINFGGKLDRFWTGCLLFSLNPQKFLLNLLVTVKMGAKGPLLFWGKPKSCSILETLVTKWDSHGTCPAWRSICSPCLSIFNREGINFFWSPPGRPRGCLCAGWAVELAPRPVEMPGYTARTVSNRRNPAYLDICRYIQTYLVLFRYTYIFRYLYIYIWRKSLFYPPVLSKTCCHA